MRFGGNESAPLTEKKSDALCQELPAHAQSLGDFAQRLAALLHYASLIEITLTREIHDGHSQAALPVN